MGKRIINCNDCKNFDNNWDTCIQKTHKGEISYYNQREDYPNKNGDCKYFQKKFLSLKLEIFSNPLFYMTFHILVFILILVVFFKNI